MEGSVLKSYHLLFRDESQHLGVSQKIINSYRNFENDKVMNKVIKDTEKEVYTLYDEASNEEKRWATYLFSKGSMIGLSEKLLHQYVEFICNRRMKAMDLNQSMKLKLIFDSGLNIG